MARRNAEDYHASMFLALLALAAIQSAAPDLVYTIRRNGDHLEALREGKAPVALAREACDVFFVPGQPRERKIFRRDAHNKVIDFVDRREGEDLVFIRGGE